MSDESFQFRKKQAMNEISWLNAAFVFSGKRKRVFECDHVIPRHDISRRTISKKDPCLPVFALMDKSIFFELHVIFVEKRMTSSNVDR